MPLRWSRGEEFHGLNGAFFLHQITYLVELPGELRLVRLGGMRLIGNTLDILSGWWFGTFVIFPYIYIIIYIYILGRIIPTDELIFFREVGIPPTR